MTKLLWRKICGLKAELQKGGPVQADGGGGGLSPLNPFTSTVQNTVPLSTEPCAQEVPANTYTLNSSTNK